MNIHEYQAKELFEKYFKYELLSIVGDRVPNVRMCLSRVLRQHFSGIGGAFVFDSDVNDAVRILKKDKSADVRDPVAEIQPLGSGADLEATDFVAKMREHVSRREEATSDDTETRASVSDWVSQETSQEQQQ